LTEPFPYLILDARYEKVREGGVIDDSGVIAPTIPEICRPGIPGLSRPSVPELSRPPIPELSGPSDGLH
jgi:hypothetical protein